jgi:hypothetical protein
MRIFSEAWQKRHHNFFRRPQNTRCGLQGNGILDRRGRRHPESDDGFGQVSIGAYKLGTMIKVSEELLNG